MGAVSPDELAERLSRLESLFQTDGEDASILMALAQHYSGPLPPPEMLERYANTIPDGADRIVKGWEDEMTHRRGMERRGQRFALTVALAAIGASVLAAYLGQPLVASSIIIASMLGIGLTGALNILLSKRR